MSGGTRSPSAEHDVALRLTIVEPPPGVAVALQRGRGARAETVAPTRARTGEASFDVVVRATAGEPPDVRGDVVQGPPAARFLYVTWGVRAGQPESRWDRRAKVPLAGLTRALLDDALASPHRALAARIAGTSRDGGPASGSVPLLEGGWRVVPRAGAAGAGDDKPDGHVA